MSTASPPSLFPSELLTDDEEGAPPPLLPAAGAEPAEFLPATELSAEGLPIFPPRAVPVFQLPASLGVWPAPTPAGPVQSP